MTDNRLFNTTQLGKQNQMRTTVMETQVRARGIPELVTKPQAAGYCGCTLAELEKLLATGEGPLIKDPTGTYPFRRADLNAYMRVKFGLTEGKTEW